MTMRRRTMLAGLASLICVSPAFAASVGPSTGLPVPRFVSLKAASANIRRGPSMTHRVDWVFQHQGMPLIVTAEYGHWRRVEDRDGMGGWVHYALLSGNRTVIVDTDLIDIRTRPEPDAQIRAEAERGVVARLRECANGWCQISADGRRGWVRQDQLWGVTLPGEPAENIALSNQ